MSIGKSFPRGTPTPHRIKGINTNAASKPTSARPFLDRQQSFPTPNAATRPYDAIPMDVDCDAVPKSLGLLGSAPAREVFGRGGAVAAGAFAEKTTCTEPESSYLWGLNAASGRASRDEASPQG